MEETTRILLAVRVGDASAGPAQTAAWLASRLGARVTLLYVATELRTVPEVEVATAISSHALRDRMIEGARDRAAEWAASALAGVAVDVVIEEGDVAERVAAVAASLDADLVVVGTEARGAIRGMILGDTTREILRRSPCPVIVVPPGAEIDED
jgi:nucleotide-binding universal stress UspA family protein